MGKIFEKQEDIPRDLCEHEKNVFPFTREAAWEEHSRNAAVEVTARGKEGGRLIKTKKTTCGSAVLG